MFAAYPSVEMPEREFGLDLRRSVPHAANRLDQMLELRTELRAQPANVHVHGPGSAVEVVTPHLSEQPGPGQDAAGSFGQEPKELELLVRQVERAPVDRHAVRVLVERH